MHRVDTFRDSKLHERTEVARRPDGSPVTRRYDGALALIEERDATPDEAAALDAQENDDRQRSQNDTFRAIITELADLEARFDRLSQAERRHGLRLAFRIAILAGQALSGEES